MICQICGTGSILEDTSCQQCHLRLGGQHRVVTVEDRGAGPRRPRDKPDYSEQALEVLKTGTPEDKISAREYLADLFESRGLIDEAIELLVTNARAGVRTVALFERLANLYAETGQFEYARMARVEVEKLAPPPPSASPAWIGHGPVALHPLDQPTHAPAPPLQQSAPKPDIAGELSAFFAALNDFRTHAKNACSQAAESRPRSAVATALDELLGEANTLTDALAAERFGARALMSSLGMMKGTLAWTQVEQARSRLSSTCAALRESRFSLGVRLGEDSFVQQALLQIISHRAGRVQVVVEQQRAQIIVAAPPDTIPRYEIKPGRARGTFVQKDRPERDVKRDYKDLIATHARDLVGMAFDAAPALQTVVISEMGTTHDQMTGHRKTVCWLSAEIDHQKFRNIIHSNVLAENALKNGVLRLDYGARDFELRPVPPLTRSSDTVRHAAGVNLDTIDPLDFERLIRSLLERMGFEARLTQASNDGGIDVHAFNPTPITGGKVVVQCKRYASTIGSPVIRDLYGALTDAGASKGILVTTSRFSAEARKFAEGKPIDLIDRVELERLLETYLS